MNPSAPQGGASIEGRREIFPRIRSDVTGDPVPGTRTLVLVIDDDDSVRRSMCRHLVRRFNVLESTSGAEGLQLAREFPPDVILLDALMPEIDGYKVLTVLMSDPATREIPTVMISGLNDVGSRVRALEMGAVDYLTKPVDPVELQARIGAAARRKLAPVEADRSRRSDTDLARHSERSSLGRQLTEREVQVVEGLFGGLTEREIAFHHGMAVGTVRSHKARIRRKLRMPSGTRFREGLEGILGSEIHQPDRASLRFW